MLNWVWVLWICAGVLLEVYTLLTPVQGDTLSETVWYWQSSPVGKFVQWMIAAFVLWLLVHWVTFGKV